MVAGFSFSDLRAQSEVHMHGLVSEVHMHGLVHVPLAVLNSMNSMPVPSPTMMWLDSVDFHFIVHGLDDLRG